MKFHIYGQSGTGIGLYLCKRIINELTADMLRGIIKAGVTVRNLMPMEVCEEQTVEGASQEVISNQGSFGNSKITRTNRR